MTGWDIVGKAAKYVAVVATGVAAGTVVATGCVYNLWKTFHDQSRS